MRHPSASPGPGRKPRPALTLTAASAAMALAMALGLGGCEPIQFGPETAEPGDTAAAEASLFLSNRREVDPGPLTFLFFPPAVQDIETVAPARTYGPVGFEKSLTVKVPAGQWKIGYRMESGDLRPMPNSESEATDAGWPVVTLSKGKAYQILIETDVGGNTVWRYDLPVNRTDF